MLREVNEVQQVPGEPRRRWFASEALDLIVWEDADRRVTGFQLCYRVDDDEKALTWRAGRGFTHNRVDDGEGRPARHKMSPVLGPGRDVRRAHRAGAVP